MRIKLIDPTPFGANERLVKTKKTFVPSLALAYLAAMLPRRHDISITEESVEEIDYREPVDLVGITTTTITAERAYRIADIFRMKGVKVVMGGIHATFMPQEALQHADAIVVGEAEDAWPALVADLEEKGAIERVYERPKRESLENLPQPRWDLINRNHYVRMPFRKSIMITMQTSRGCPHNCNFCSVTQFWGSKMRYRPVPEVVEEIKASKSDTIFFTDDNLLFNAKRAEELLTAIVPLKIKFMCQLEARVHRNPELIRLLHKAGCLIAFIGLETINPETLKDYNKGFNKPEEYHHLFQTFNDNDINIYASFMLGHDGDTIEQAIETADLLIRDKVSKAMFFPLTALPGTALYENLKAQGRLPESWWLNQSILRTIDKQVIQYAEGQPTGETLRGVAMRRFYSWPSILRRFTRISRNRLMCLPLNIATKRVLDKYGVVSI